MVVGVRGGGGDQGCLGGVSKTLAASFISLYVSFLQQPEEIQIEYSVQAPVATPRHITPQQTGQSLTVSGRLPKPPKEKAAGAKDCLQHPTQTVQHLQNAGRQLSPKEKQAPNSGPTTKGAAPITKQGKKQPPKKGTTTQKDVKEALATTATREKKVTQSHWFFYKSLNNSNLKVGHCYEMSCLIDLFW